MSWEVGEIPYTPWDTVGSRWDIVLSLWDTVEYRGKSVGYRETVHTVGCDGKSVGYLGIPWEVDRIHCCIDIRWELQQ